MTSASSLPAILEPISISSLILWFWWQTCSKLARQPVPSVSCWDISLSAHWFAYHPHSLSDATSPHPYLHFRFLLISVRRPLDFGHLYLFKAWLIRQVRIVFSLNQNVGSDPSSQLKVFAGGIISIVRNSNLSPFEINGSMWNRQECEFILITMFRDFFLTHVGKCDRIEVTPCYPLPNPHNPPFT